ncbi:MAG: ankyrin repeat domain-containing protein, partial [Candidatus Vecturithrix sp.]|nr:ankyrin repeat domain-containing protein [Candidatus Vecturithrix sp.]
MKIRAESYIVIVLCLCLVAGCQSKPENQAEAQQSGNTLFEAVWNGDQQRVVSLLGKGIDVNVRDSYQATPLMYSAHRRNEAIMRLLLERQANVNASDNRQTTALMEAVLKDCLGCVNLL